MPRLKIDSPIVKSCYLVTTTSYVAMDSGFAALLASSLGGDVLENNLLTHYHWRMITYSEQTFRSLLHLDLATYLVKI